MDLVGSIVRHKIGGCGIIETFADGIITVRFSEMTKGEKVSKFCFPDAFSQGFLVANDDDSASRIHLAMNESTCTICGTRKLCTELIDGKRFCIECKQHNTFVCSFCEKVHDKTAMLFVTEVEYTHIKIPICESCAKKKSFCCDKCEHRYLNKHRAASQLEGHTLCQRCYIDTLKQPKTSRCPTFTMDENNTLYVLLGNDECYKHRALPIQIIVKLKNNKEITLDGQYCLECKQVQISRNIFAENNHYHEVMACNFVIKGLELENDESIYEDPDYEFQKRAKESKLKKYGYSVAQNNQLTNTERQDLLRSIIASRKVSKGYVISYLKHMIFINGKKQSNDVAVKKWESDLEYVLKLDL